MPLIGYARVSTEDQTTLPQSDELRAAGCQIIHQEQASGGSRTRPVLSHLLSVLGDQFPDVREHEHTGLGPVLQGILAQRGHNVALARASRQHEAGVAPATGIEPSVKLVNGALLVVTEH